MPSRKLPPQVLRLLLLIVGVVVVYLLAKAILTPSSFDEYGHYRGSALAEVASQTPVYAGQKACVECHSKALEVVAKFEHKTISCESCHGVNQPHIQNPEIKTTKLTDSHCVRCHERNPSRPAWLKQVTAKDHYHGQRCAECHTPHQPNEI
jgi:hypothetical protein